MAKNLICKKNLSIYLAAILAVILIGALLWFALGGNFGVDFVGGNSLTVEFSRDIPEEEYKDLTQEEYEELAKKYTYLTDDEYNQVKKDLTASLKAVGFKPVTVQKISKLADENQGIYFEFQSKLKGKSASDETMFAAGVLLTEGESGLTASQKTELQKYLGDNFNFASVETAESIVSAAVKSETLAYTLTTASAFKSVAASKIAGTLAANAALVAGVGILAACVYVVFRFFKLGFEHNAPLNSVRNVLSVIITAIAACLSSLALSIIFSVVTGIALQANFIAALAVSVFISLLFSAVLLNRLSNGQAEGAGDLANSAIKKSLLPIALIGGATILASIAVAIFSATIGWSFMMTVAAGVIMSGFCSLFLLPSLWDIMKFKSSGVRLIDEEDSE